MPKRATVCYSISIIILAMFAALAGSLSPVSAQEPSSLNEKTPCLVKYSTLSALMCEKKETTVLIDVKGIVSPSPSPSASPAESPIREMKGIKKSYIYTDRITKDSAGLYTKMREKADVKSEKGEMLRPGDKIRVMKTDTKGWYYAQIFKSNDSKLEGKAGWIERWLVDDENVPAEPSPTPTAIPEVKGASREASSDLGESAGGSTSGDGETMFNMINSYRTGNGLPAFEKSARLCSIAQERAPEVAGEVATGTVHAGFHRRGLGYPVAIENEVGYGNLQTNFNWWINSSLHRTSILDPNLKYSCVECSSGNCVQEFSPNP